MSKLSIIAASEVCKKWFAKKSSLKYHENSAHNKLKTTFKCILCSKVFSHKSNLKIHIKIVHEKVKVECENCSKTFASKSNLKVHSKLHMKIKSSESLKCILCDKEFRHRWNLNSHLAIVHEKIRPYRCECCNKTFSKKGNLKQHSKIHLNVNQN